MKAHQLQLCIGAMALKTESKGVLNGVSANKNTTKAPHKESSTEPSVNTQRPLEEEDCWASQMQNATFCLSRIESAGS